MVQKRPEMVRRTEQALRKFGFLKPGETLTRAEQEAIEESQNEQQKTRESRAEREVGQLMMGELVDDVQDVYGSGHSLTEIRESVETRTDVLKNLESQIDSHRKYHDEFMGDAEDADTRTEAFQYARKASREQWQLRMKEKLRDKIFSEMEELDKKAMAAEMGAVDEQEVFGVTTDDFEDDRTAEEIRQTTDRFEENISEKSKADIELDNMMERTGVASVQEKMDQVDRLRDGELTEEEVTVDINPVPGTMDETSENEGETEGREEAGSVYDN
jgi:hypothetical protein